MFIRRLLLIRNLALAMTACAAVSCAFIANNDHRLDPSIEIALWDIAGVSLDFQKEFAGLLRCGRVC
jgi:hypothetical protein